MKNCKKFLFIAIVFLSLSALYSSAAIVTNFVSHYAAPNGSILIYVSVFDTITFNSYISSLKIIDKKNKTLFDGQLSGQYNWIVDFDGKSAVFTNGSENKIASYKLKGKSFELINELLISNFSHAHVAGKILYVFTFSGLNTGLTAYNKTLSKTLFEIPSSNRQFLKEFANGVVAQSDKSIGIEAITFTKKGKSYSTHNIAIPTGSFLQKEVDQKGGVIYWFNNGITNSPVTYLNKKSKKIPDNFQLDSEVGIAWSAQAWSGKNFYVGNSDNTKIYVFKIGKKSALLNSIQGEPFSSSVVLDKSKVFIDNYATINNAYVSNYDKNLKSQKWKKSGFDYVDYLGNAAFEGGIFIGGTNTITIFKSDKKTIANHTYTGK